VYGSGTKEGKKKKKKKKKGKRKRSLLGGFSFPK
jgi:hypothetical protein